MSNILVVGRGLAGSVLAWQMKERGASVTVIDQSSPASASNVAQGLMDPISGVRLNAIWDIVRTLPFALNFYHDLSAKFSTQLVQSKRSLRLLRDDGQKAFLRRNASDPQFASMLAALFPAGFFESHLNDQHGSFLMTTHQLDVRLFIAQIRQHSTNSILWNDSPFRYDEVVLQDSKVIYQSKIFDKIIFCEGSQFQANPWFSRVPIEGIKGDVLTVQTDFKFPLGIDVLSRDSFITPADEEGLVKIGATFDRRFTQTVPDPLAVTELFAKTCDIIPGFTGTVVRHETGVRPCSLDKKPIMGSHFEHRNLWFFNGFGSKGCLWIPYYAAALCRSIEEGVDLEPAVSIQRFAKKMVS